MENRNSNSSSSSNRHAFITTMTAPQRMYRKYRQQQWRRQIAMVVGGILLVWIASKTLFDSNSNSRTEGTIGDGLLTLASPAFEYGAPIPITYARDGGGDNVPPPLMWSGKLPTNTASFALIVDDPDAPDPMAPKVVWVHWVVYNIPVTTITNTKTTVSTGGTKETTLLPVRDNTAKVGLNDWKLARYDGPSPPFGRHRYFFKLYALDVMLQLDGGGDSTSATASSNLPPTKAALEQAMQGHILGTATLMGTFQKKPQAR